MNVILCECNYLSFIYCIYLMHSLHHILLHHYDYLMMQSCLWQMVRTRATEDDVLDIPEGSSHADVTVDSPLVAMHRRHPRIRRSAWNSYWLRRMSS
jgi:hypothetical protein